MNATYPLDTCPVPANQPGWENPWSQLLIPELGPWEQVRLLVPCNGDLPKGALDIEFNKPLDYRYDGVLFESVVRESMVCEVIVGNYNPYPMSVSPVFVRFRSYKEREAQ